MNEKERRIFIEENKMKKEKLEELENITGGILYPHQDKSKQAPTIDSITPDDGPADSMGNAMKDSARNYFLH